MFIRGRGRNNAESKMNVQEVENSGRRKIMRVKRVTRCNRMSWLVRWFVVNCHVSTFSSSFLIPIYMPSSLLSWICTRQRVLTLSRVHYTHVVQLFTLLFGDV